MKYYIIALLCFLFGLTFNIEYFPPYYAEITGIFKIEWKPLEVGLLIKWRKNYILTTINWTVYRYEPCYNPPVIKKS